MTADSAPTGQPTDHPSLFVLLATRARHVSDGRLVVDAAGGTLVAAAVLLMMPSLWLVAMPAAALAGFGTWGIADRGVADTARSLVVHRLWSAVRIAAAIVGVAAGVAFLLGAMALMLGNWIS